MSCDSVDHTIRWGITILMNHTNSSTVSNALLISKLRCAAPVINQYNPNKQKLYLCLVLTMLFFKNIINIAILRSFHCAIDHY